MMNKKILGFTVILMLGYWAIAGAHRNPENSPTAGGTGGTAFSKNCGHAAGRILIGITGRTGIWVDSIRGVCASVNEVGMMIKISKTPRVGGDGGERNFDFRCPTGHALVGVHGSAVWYIHKIGITCKRLGRDGTLHRFGEPRKVGGDNHPFTSGGPGGRAFDIRCRNNLPARSLRGRAGSVVDQISLGCHPAKVLEIVPTVDWDYTVAIKGLPYVAGLDEGFTIRFEIWNLGRKKAPRTGNQRVYVDLSGYWPYEPFNAVRPVVTLDHGGECLKSPIPGAPGNVYYRCFTTSDTYRVKGLKLSASSRFVQYNNPNSGMRDVTAKVTVPAGTYRGQTMLRELPLQLLNNKVTVTMRQPTHR